MRWEHVHEDSIRRLLLDTVSRRGVWAYYAADARGVALLRGSLESCAPSLLAAAG